MRVEIAQEVRERFPDLHLAQVELRDLSIKREDDGLEKFKREVIESIKAKYTLETLKDERLLRAYRDFFWQIGIDPTKVRPASEALIRRVLQGKSIPKINTLVDAYNLASMRMNVAIGAFDLEKINALLVLRFSEGEEFLGIGMKEPIKLKGGEIVLSDSDSIVAVYPYRDSEHTKVTLGTERVLIISCGVPKIEMNILKSTIDLTVDYVRRFCGGELIQ